MVKNAEDLWMESDDPEMKDLLEQIDDQEAEIDDMQQEIDEQKQIIHDQQERITHQEKIIHELQQRVDRGTEIMGQQLKITSKMLKLFQGLAEEVQRKCGSLTNLEIGPVTVIDQPGEGTSTDFFMAASSSLKAGPSDDAGGRK